MSQKAKDALQKYNVEAIQKFKSSRNLNETQLIHTLSKHAQDELHGLYVVSGDEVPKHVCSRSPDLPYLTLLDIS